MKMTKTADDKNAAPFAGQFAATVSDPIGATNEALRSGFEKLKSSSAVMSEHNKANIEAMTESAKIAFKSFEEVTAITAAYIKTATEQVTAAAKTLSTAKSIQEVVEVQADYARNALDTYVADFNKVANVMFGAMKGGAKPISDRASASFAALQSAK
jgi:phasin family protein